MTDLELTVAWRICKGRDPWDGRRGVGSRTVSGALGRLQRKLFVEYVNTEYTLTLSGREYLDNHPEAP
jgi:hypothetical protein